MHSLWTDCEETTPEIVDKVVQSRRPSGHVSAGLSDHYAPGEDSLRMVFATLSREEHIVGKPQEHR